MKTPFLLCLLLAFALGASSQAAPFLISDTYPAGLSQATMPTKFIIKGLSASAITTGATTNSDGTIMLHFDLATIANGSYTVTADAVNALGGISPDSLPFSFTVGVPAVPSNLRISPL